MRAAGRTKIDKRKKGVFKLQSKKLGALSNLGQRVTVWQKQRKVSSEDLESPESQIKYPQYFVQYLKEIARGETDNAFGFEALGHLSALVEELLGRVST